MHAVNQLPHLLPATHWIIIIDLRVNNEIVTIFESYFLTVLNLKVKSTSVIANPSFITISVVHM